MLRLYARVNPGAMRGKGAARAKKNPAGIAPGGVWHFTGWGGYAAPCASAASSSRATMLVILIIGFTAGPAVSL